MALVSPAIVARRILLTVPRVDSRVLVYVAAFACIPLAFLVYWPRVSDFFVFDDYLNLATVRNHSFPGGMVRALRIARSIVSSSARGFRIHAVDHTR